MRVRMVGGSDVGKVRKSNQDSFFYDGAQGIAVVADGIGGRKGGEVASRIAVEGMRSAFLESDSLRLEEINPFLTEAVDSTNNKIIEHGERQSEVQGMGTTLNFLMFVADRVHIAHVGDSRTYLFYKGHIWQLTIDHNIETFVARGWMSRDDVGPGTRDGALVRSLGLTGRCETDIYDIQLQTGQVFITCSDGLSGMVSDKRIGQIVSQYENNIARLPKALIDEANKNGGKDNTTVVISQVRD